LLTRLFSDALARMPESPANDVVSVIEILLLLAGAILLWRFGWRRNSAGGTPQSADALAPWSVSISDFLLYVLVIIAGCLVSSLVCDAILRSVKAATDTKTILNSAAFQIGLLIGAALVPLQLGHPTLRFLNRDTLRSGLVTFLIALPIVTAVNVGWLFFLKTTGLPAEQQDLLRMFAQADSTTLLTLMVVLATVIAPMTEELLFRATLFRYARTRLPRWIALLVPGIIFAALHVNWHNLDGLASFAPLVTLAVVFSIAYERTGRIGTAIVAHALFNLHTIAVLFFGGAE
jgi:uncharacterized protein